MCPFGWRVVPGFCSNTKLDLPAGGDAEIGRLLRTAGYLSECVWVSFIG